MSRRLFQICFGDPYLLPWYASSRRFGLQVSVRCLWFNDFRYMAKETLCGQGILAWPTLNGP